SARATNVVAEWVTPGHGKGEIDRAGGVVAEWWHHGDLAKRARRWHRRPGLPSMTILSPDQIPLFLLLMLPGFISRKAYDLQVPGAQDDAGRYAMDALFTVQ